MFFKFLISFEIYKPASKGVKLVYCFMLSSSCQKALFFFLFLEISVSSELFYSKKKKKKKNYFRNYPGSAYINLLCLKEFWTRLFVEKTAFFFLYVYIVDFSFTSFVASKTFYPNWPGYMALLMAFQFLYSSLGQHFNNPLIE